MTTVERSALYSVAIWCSSKWRSWVKPSDLVERHPLVELADLDVADDVVDAFETDRRAGRFGRQVGRDVARAVVAEVVAAVDEGVLRLAVRADRGEAQRALVVGQLVRLAHRAGTAGEGRLVGRGRVVDDERQVLGAVTVLAHVASRSASRA